MARRITFVGVVRFTDRVLVAGYSPSEADDALIIKEVQRACFSLSGCFADTRDMRCVSAQQAAHIYTTTIIRTVG